MERVKNGDAMDDSSLSPPIDPAAFDLIVVGTGVPESVIAAAASSAGKSVLHLDPNPFYGSHFASLSLQETVSFLQFDSTGAAVSSSVDSGDSEFTVIDLTTKPLISDAEVSPVPPEVERCGRFSLDISGPRVFFCTDSAVNLMSKAGISEYLDFKAVNASFAYDGNGGLSRVPLSRQEIFIYSDKSLGDMGRIRLWKLFKLVKQYLESTGSNGGEAHENTQRNLKTTWPEDMDKPFMELITRLKLNSPKIKSDILYAIAMADYDQEGDDCKHLLKTSEAMRHLALFLTSIERFPSAASGMLYPMYGHGEVPQAFCRRAAVKGSIYVLRMPVVALLVEKDSRIYKGIKLGSGQEILSDQLVLDPCFKIPPSLDTGSPQGLNEHLEDPSPRESKVARGICITRKSIKSEGSNLLVVYPPRSLYPQQATSVRALQIGDSAVCPSNTFVFYVSTPCEDASEGKKSIRAAIDALFACPDGEAPKSTTSEGSENSEDAEDDDKPTLLWSAIYIQEVLKGSRHSIVSAPSPDANLSYNDLIDASLKLFHEMYPGAELFPEKTQSKNSEEEDEHELSKDEDRPTGQLSVEGSDSFTPITS